MTVNADKMNGKWIEVEADRFESQYSCLNVGKIL